MSIRRWNSWVPWVGFILALGLRLWNLGIPAQIVSDEISFVNDGRDYGNHQMYFDPHPPLGKMEIGAAIALFGDRPTIWRLADALEGALIVPLIWWITSRLTKRRVAANIALILALLDGLLLVDSRLGLINVPYVLSALIACACLLKALDERRPLRWLFLTGIFLGVGMATKWLAALIAVPLIGFWIWPSKLGFQRHPEQNRPSWWMNIVVLGGVPMFVYWLVFVGHFAWLGAAQDFFSLNMRMLNYHLSVPSTGDPNQQPWWGWLVAWRPFPYWTENHGDVISIMRSLPNPWVWWSGSALVLYQLIRGWRLNITRALNILLLCAWIPFLFIQRVMYSYHALLFDVWMIIAVAVALDRFWGRYRRLVMLYIVTAVLVFAWFAPWYLNIPLTPIQHHLRQWLPSWSIS